MLTLPHRETGLSVETLSEDLKSKYNSLELRIDQFLKNPMNEKLKSEIEHASARLGHAILDYAQEQSKQPQGSEPQQKKTEAGTDKKDGDTSQGGNQQTDSGQSSQAQQQNNTSTGGAGVFDLFF